MAAGPSTLHKTTVQQRIVPDGAAGYRDLGLGPGEPYLVRTDLGGTTTSNRAKRRRSLVYFGQLSDFQLADEESPARVEFLDPPNGTQFPFDAAWRPQEALQPQVDDASIRQLNSFAAASPVASSGAHRAMDFTIDTGDSADSQQLNETEWVRTLLEGGTLNPNSGIDPLGYVHPLCPPAGVPGAAEAARYTGVQDYSDYVEGTNPSYYDPDDVRGSFAGWPTYPGLMDKAQAPFQAAGVSVPSYVVFGNHDGLVQGNQAANQSFEQIATGCIKPMVASPEQDDFPGALTSLTPDSVLALAASDPANVMLVPPDPKRQYVSKVQYKQVFESGSQADGHGFGHIDPDQEAASHGEAGYYAWSPVPGMRFIGLDTVSEGGIAGPSADGNVDDPQFRWLESELQAASARDELIVLFSHHAIGSLTSQVPDEAAPPCTVDDPHGHDLNPGCDVDPRDSSPIHLGADLEALLHRYPNVIAWVAGHSHVNDVQAHPDPDGSGGFWSIRTAAEADWPQQNRLIEVMNNRDGTLSIFGTILDTAADPTAPPSGTAAAAMSLNQLASAARTIAYNDPQKGARACDPACGEGAPEDRNVELLLPDPRVG